MTHGSLFSGIGGFDLAAEWVGWSNVFHCEWNPFGARVLRHYWPQATSYHDITQTDFTLHRGAIDVLSGGFPCQPYSSAGKRLGKNDDRHLWPHMLRAVREVRPRWVVGENVLGLVNWNGGLVFDEVQADLEAEGFEVLPFVLPAAAVGAPHRRDRVWFVAYADGLRLELRENAGEVAGRSKKVERQGHKFATQFKANGPTQFFTDVDGLRRDRRLCQNEIEPGQAGLDALGNLEPHDEGRTTSDTDSDRLQGSVQSGINGEQQWYQSSKSSAKCLCNCRKKMEAGRWDNFPTQPPVCGGNDGLPIELDGITFSKWRKESVKAYGNAIVPQVALQIFQTIQDYENQLP